MLLVPLSDSSKLLYLMSNYNVDPVSGQWHSIVKFTSKTVTIRISAASAKQLVSIQFHHRDRGFTLTIKYQRSWILDLQPWISDRNMNTILITSPNMSTPYHTKIKKQYWGTLHICSKLYTVVALLKTCT